MGKKSKRAAKPERKGVQNQCEVQRKGGRVVVTFKVPTQAMLLTPKEAMAFAKALIGTAREASDFDLRSGVGLAKCT